MVLFLFGMKCPAQCETQRINCLHNWLRCSIFMNEIYDWHWHYDRNVTYSHIHLKESHFKRQTFIDLDAVVVCWTIPKANRNLFYAMAGVNAMKTNKMTKTVQLSSLVDHWSEKTSEKHKIRPIRWTVSIHEGKCHDRRVLSSCVCVRLVGNYSSNINTDGQRTLFERLFSFLSKENHFFSFCIELNE